MSPCYQGELVRQTSPAGNSRNGIANCHDSYRRYFGCSLYTHTHPLLLQLIYDFKDGGASLGLISLHPEKLSEEDKMKLKKIGVKIPSKM